MSCCPHSSLPDSSGWHFDEIASCEPDRAHLLEVAGPPGDLLREVTGALDAALASGDLRVGREHAAGHWDDCRAVLQFGVGARIFDWFFNGRTGYRAHFRQHHACGMGFNNQIIEALRHCLDAGLREVVPCRELDSEFKDCGGTEVPKSFLVQSLVMDLSKVWFCTNRLRPGGGTELLPMGIVGPRILLDGNVSWAAPYRGDETAWLDVKGAFLGDRGPYQPKDPVKRAERLQATGEA